MEKKIHKTLWKPLNFNLIDVPKEIYNFLLSTWKNTQKLLQNKLGPCCFCLCIFWSTPTANSSWCLLMRHFPWRNYSYIYAIFLLLCLLWWLCKWVLPAGAHSEAKTSRPEILFRSSITKLVPDTGGSAETTELKNFCHTSSSVSTTGSGDKGCAALSEHTYTDTQTHTHASSQHINSLLQCSFCLWYLLLSGNKS